MSGLMSSQYVNGVYIPAGLLIVGTAIMKKEWVPFAVALAAVLGAYKVFSNSEFRFITMSCAFGMHSSKMIEV
jgi:cytochrome-b5 reductase